MSATRNIHEHQLDNGLRVLIRPMHTAPVVSVWIWYRAGSRCERAGITGISHWVEHMLFKGTPEFPKGEIFKSVCRVGGSNNGFTREDDTVYFETLPAEHWELGLRIESSRMVRSLFDPDEVAGERTVIISEREGGENNPQNRLFEEVQAAAYHVHPYGHPVVGHRCDLETMTRDDLYDYYREFYAPDNATVVLVGALDPADAIERVKQHFGEIAPAGRPRELRAVEPAQVGERRVEVRRPGNAVYWCGAWHIPAYAHEDRLPLTVLEAVFSGARAVGGGEGLHFGKSARLHEVLVNRRKLAAWVGAHGRFMRDPGLFLIFMMLRDGVAPERAEAAVLREIERLGERGPTNDELATARRQVEAQVEYARDGITGNAYMIGNQDSLGDLAELETLVERVAAVSAEDVARVAQTCLARNNRTVGVFIPEGNGAPAAAGAVAAPGFFPGVPPAFAAPLHLTAGGGNDAHPLPRIREARLSCGVRVLGIESPESHAMAIEGFVRAGAALDPAGKEGLAWLTARMLDQGTSKKTCRRIARATDRIGASLSFSAAADAVSFSLHCLPRDARRVLSLARECLADMAAPREQFDKMLQLALTAIKADRDSTRWMASRAAAEALYPEEHPYHRDSRGTPETLTALAPDDLVAFARRFFSPSNLTLAVCGPVAFDRTCRIIERALADWDGGENIPVVDSPPVTQAASPGERTITMPGKSQCDIVMNWPAVTRTHPDYHPLLLGTHIFGGFGLMGRIGSRIRDRMGLAYYVYARLRAGLRAGEWTIQAGVNPANVRKALAALHEEADRIHREPVTEEELRDSIGSIIGSLPLRMETSAALCGIVREIAFYDLPLDYLERSREEIRSVTRERILEACRTCLRTCEPVVVVAGPPLPAEA